MSMVLTSLGQGNDPFEDYNQFKFSFEGHSAKIIYPKYQNAEQTWIWRARFWGHEPQTDLALLRRGFYVVHIDVADLYGNQEAVALWNRFYQFLIKKYPLNTKCVLEGLSRGGLIVYNWAAENTDKVACIYADAPVCDIKSWPGGQGKGEGSPLDWEKCLSAYGLTEETVADFKGIPLYNCVKVAQAGIPVLHVCGDSDTAVPMEENTTILAKNFREAGGTIEVMVKKGVGHHPHSFEDPAPIVEFIIKNTGI